MVCCEEEARGGEEAQTKKRQGGMVSYCVFSSYSAIVLHFDKAYFEKVHLNCKGRLSSKSLR